MHRRCEGMVMSRGISGLLNGFYLRVRDPNAFKAAAEAGTAQDFSSLRGHKYCLLVTFRRTGEPVPTPVWFGLDADGRLYVRSESHVGKVKRIRNDPHVRVGPCTFRGKPITGMAEGHARVLSASEDERAEAALRANYGLGRRLYESTGQAVGIETVYLEIVPAGLG